MNYIYSDFSRNDSQRWFSKERSQNGLRFAVENCPHWISHIRINLHIRCFLFCHDTLHDFCCYHVMLAISLTSCKTWAWRQTWVTSHMALEKIWAFLSTVLWTTLCVPKNLVFFLLYEMVHDNLFKNSTSSRHARIIEWCHIMASTGQRSTTSPLQPLHLRHSHVMLYPKKSKF